MGFRELLRRELRIALGARVTWLALAAAAVLIGHGFVLALDLFSAASRSALGLGLMRHQMDPLMGVIRPMLGGLDVSASLLVPVVATRGLAIERERGSYGALALAVSGTTPLVVAKGLAALAASLLLVLPCVALTGLFVALGGHVDAGETLIATGGHLLHVTALTAVALAAAAGSRSVAQATTVAIMVSLLSWAIDAGEGFAALAWLGSVDWLSISGQLEPFERGILAAGSVAWLALLTLIGGVLSLVLARIDRPLRRWAPALVALLAGLLLLRAAAALPFAYDGSEKQRQSLPSSVAHALRALPGPVALELHLDRDDGRRAEIERNVLGPLRLARPELAVDAPLDRRAELREGERDEGYGRIVVHVGSASRETRSTSVDEVVRLLFEAAGARPPAEEPPSYPGYPVVIEGARRSLAVSIAYGVLPLAVVVVGWSATRIRRRTA